MSEIETFAFQPEIERLLKAMRSAVIAYDHSYVQIFLRELIVNACNALDKLGSQKGLFIHIIPSILNPYMAKNTLTIHDNGIGMTRADLVNNLGNLATSNMRKFMDVAADDDAFVREYSGVGTKNIGVGFYSAFLVAEKVIVTTKHKDDEQYMWESTASNGSFTVTRDTSGEPLRRGTKITLYLKEDQLEYLEEKHLKDLVKKHAKHANVSSYPIHVIFYVPKIKNFDDDVEDEDLDFRTRTMYTSMSTGTTSFYLSLLNGLEADHRYQRAIVKETSCHFLSSEVCMLLKAIRDHLYSDTKIFLRELISNASNALDKIFFESLEDTSKLDGQPQLFILIIPDRENNTLTIVDSGIGMTKADLAENLAHFRLSGMGEFTNAIYDGETYKLGQFGVGFYSAYLVAERVIVTTKHNDDEQYVWEFRTNQRSCYMVERDVLGEVLGRGTKITLYLKEDQLGYLEERYLKDLLREHAKVIRYPIFLCMKKTIEEIRHAEGEYKYIACQILKNIYIPRKFEHLTIQEDEDAGEADADMPPSEEETEIFAFKPDIKRLLSAIRDHLYSDTKIFLRELISNASNALDKLDRQPELFIHIIPDRAKNTLTIHDNGIGMTRADLVNNLGNLATSNMRKFMDAAADDDAFVRENIAVGFYSAFLVAEKVIVTTKHNDDEQYLWETTASNGSFTVTRDTSGEPLRRGTKITLYLKEDQLEYLDESYLKHLLRKHAKVIDHPFFLCIGNTFEEIYHFEGEYDHIAYWIQLHYKVLWKKFFEDNDYVEDGEEDVDFWNWQVQRFLLEEAGAVEDVEVDVDSF